MFTINDHSAGKTYECEDRFDLEEKLHELFDGFEEDVEGTDEAVEAIIRGINRREYTGDYEQFLGISIERS